MPQSLSKLYTHIIFSTKYREPFLKDDNLRNQLYKYIGKIITEYDSHPIIINGTSNHIHILCILSKNISLSNLIGKIKRNSSKWIKNKRKRLKNFYWQRGYGAFSINESIKDDVIKYIKNQEKHHRKMSFKQEYRKSLNNYDISYSEKYVWD